MQVPVYRRTRIAPTPSGFLHLGNVLSFAMTAAKARETGAAILLRIDDLDRQRVQQPYVQDIFDTLHYLDIPWTEGPVDEVQYEQQFSQLHRLGLYKTALAQLQENGQVFACDCSRSTILQQCNDGIYTGTCRQKGIPLDTPGVNWRLQTNPDTILKMKTPAGLIETTLPAAMQDFVVKKKDGFPAYQLSSVIDDVHFKVDLVVRGEDLWESTLAQLYLAQVLELPAFSNSCFIHHPLLLDMDQQKLSKSAGSTSIRALRQAGKTPAAIYTLIAQRLGYLQPVETWQELAAQIVP